MSRSTLLIVVALVPLTTSVAGAQPSPMIERRNDIAVMLTPYVWQVSDSSLGVAAFDRTSLPFGACFGAELREERTLAQLDFMYTPQSGATSAGPVPRAYAEARLLMGDVMLGYRMRAVPRTTIDLIAGVRIAALGARDDWGNALVGVRPTVRLSSRVYATATADVGGEFPDALGSSRSWRLDGAVGWQLSPRAALVGGYKHVYLKRDHNDFHVVIHRAGVFAAIRVVASGTP